MVRVMIVIECHHSESKQINIDETTSTIDGTLARAALTDSSGIDLSPSNPIITSKIKNISNLVRNWQYIYKYIFHLKHFSGSIWGSNTIQKVANQEKMFKEKKNESEL